MRILVAGRNAKALATTAGAFADDLIIETAATIAACIALLEHNKFDLIVACETLGDGSGLDVLSHAAVNTPDTLRIFAARPSTLKVLQGDLGLFGLFRVLPYPINFRKLWAALKLARSCCVEAESKTGGREKGQEPAVLQVRRGPSPGVRAPRAAVRTARTATAAGSDIGARPAAAAAARAGAAVNGGRAAHVVAPPQGVQPRQGAQARAIPAAQRSAHTAVATAGTAAAAGSGTVARGASAASARTGAIVNNGTATHAASPSRQVLPHQAAASQSNLASRQATAAPRCSARIPESEAFKRALAKRNAAKLESNADMLAVDVLGAARQPHGTGERDERRREPRMSNDSLAQLARLTITRRPTYDSRSTPRGKRRAAFFVGSGVFAAAAVLTLFMLNESNSMGRSPPPLVASIDRPGAQKVFPWQPAPQQSTGTMPVRSDGSAPAAADLEVQAEAASDASAVEPGHPGPPPPNPPPPPSEPPPADTPTNGVDE